MSSSPLQRKLAIVLSGGGARGAYEAGIIHYIRTMLPDTARLTNFDIYCGSSVGALNVSFLAATAHDPDFQGRELRRIWETVRDPNIYRTDKQALLGFLSRTSRSIFLNLIKKGGKKTHFEGMLDTSPFLPYIEHVIPWSMISKNVRQGIVRAISIVATNVFTGRMELFIEKRPDIEYTGEYLTHFTKIQAVHAKASAALPIVFPSVFIDGIAYVDGGLRLNTPMSPAIQLGADSLLIIGLHHRSRPGEPIPFHGEIGVPPSLGQIVGRVMNSIFLDRIQYDIEQLERINRVIDWGDMLYGKNFLPDLNSMLYREKIRGDIANRGLKRLKVLRIRPSQDIGEIFNECYKKERSARRSSVFEKFLLRAFDIDPEGGIDFLSYISFRPEYLKRLLDLGFEDARYHHDQLREFLER